MRIEQIIEFQLRGSGPPSRTYTTKTGSFHDKKNLQCKSSNEFLYTAKNTAKGNVSCLPTWTK